MKKPTSLHQLIVFFVAIITVAIIVSSAQGGDPDELAYLPLVVDGPTVTPTPTATPTATNTPTPTNTPTATPTNEPLPPTSSGDVRIVTIFYDGVVSSQEPDEYVVIRNYDAAPVQLENWTLRDANGANPKTFTFPNFIIQPGQSCRIYTNEIHPETCGFSYGNSAAIWNNSGDCGTLRNSSGVSMDVYCYD